MGRKQNLQYLKAIKESEQSPFCWSSFLIWLQVAFEPLSAQGLIDGVFVHLPIPFYKIGIIRHWGGVVKDYPTLSRGLN